MLGYCNGHHFCCKYGGSGSIPGPAKSDTTLHNNAMSNQHSCMESNIAPELQKNFSSVVIKCGSVA